MNELTINKGTVATGMLWMMTRTFLNQGKFPEYEAWMKNDWKPAMEKAGVTQLRVSRPIFGVPGGEVQTLRMLKDFAEIDGAEMIDDWEALPPMLVATIPMAHKNDEWAGFLNAASSFSSGPVIADR